MSTFTVRVELHSATDKDYENLHIKMEAHGYKRYVPGTDSSGASGIWRLPTAEYDFEADLSARQVRDAVKAIADSIRPKAWVLVTEVKTRSWNTEKIRSTGN